MVISTNSIFAANIYVNADQCRKCDVSPYATMVQAARSIGDALGVATVGDTVILKGATSNTYNGFQVKDGGTVTSEIPGVEYPEVTGSVDFNGDMPNGGHSRILGA